jgi:hypothetical protein
MVDPETAGASVMKLLGIKIELFSDASVSIGQTLEQR